MSIESGGDTTVSGAVVRADRVEADVGGDLLIESLQDRVTYKERSSQAGGSAFIGFGMSSGGSFSAGATDIDSEFTSVAEQSGIRAGDGGFDVKVQGKTTLKGGALTSTQVAVDEGRNSVDSAGGLELQDLQNAANYRAKASGVTLGAGDQLSSSGAGVGSDQREVQSITAAAISGIAGNKDARTGDAQTGLAPIFDKERVKDEVEAQVAITKGFGQQASRAVGDHAQRQLQDADNKLKQAQEAEAAGNAALAGRLRAEAQQLQNDWGASGTKRLLTHTVVGALTGGADGAAGAATGMLTAPIVADALRNAGVDGALANTLTALASSATGAAAGGVAGASGALNEATHNYLSHPERAALDKADKACKASGQQCDTAAALKYKDELSDRLLANAAARCEGEGCNDTVNFINQQLAAVGCSAPQACPDQRHLLQYWSVAQQKAQGLEGVYPETWLLDAKAVLDLAKFGMTLSRGAMVGATGSLDALKQLAKLDVSKIESSFYRDGARPIHWTPGGINDAGLNLADHWARHGAEFPPLRSANDYAAAANKFVVDPPVGTLSHVRANGDRLFYDPASNIFAVQAPSGLPRTMFKPDAGLSYWQKQIGVAR